MKTNVRTIFNLVNVLIWIVFILLCIKTGAMIVSLVITLSMDVPAIKGFYSEAAINLQNLYDFSAGHHLVVYILLILFSALQAHIAYLAVRVFMQLRLDRPFDEKVTFLIMRMSYVALGTGVFAVLGEAYSEWLRDQGVVMPDNWNGGSFLLLAGLIFILSVVFRRGTELQNENELTV